MRHLTTRFGSVWCTFFARCVLWSSEHPGFNVWSHQWRRKQEQRELYEPQTARQSEELIGWLGPPNASRGWPAVQGYSCRWLCSMVRAKKAHRKSKTKAASGTKQKNCVLWVSQCRRIQFTVPGAASVLQSEQLVIPSTRGTFQPCAEAPQRARQRLQSWTHAWTQLRTA